MPAPCSSCSDVGAIIDLFFGLTTSHIWISWTLDSFQRQDLCIQCDPLTGLQDYEACVGECCLPGYSCVYDAPDYDFNCCAALPLVTSPGLRACSVHWAAMAASVTLLGYTCQQRKRRLRSSVASAVTV